MVGENVEKVVLVKYYWEANRNGNKNGNDSSSVPRNCYL